MEKNQYELCIEVLRRLGKAGGRSKEEKSIKDRNTAVGILKALIDKGEIDLIKEIFNSLLPKWKEKVLKELHEAKEPTISDHL